MASHETNGRNADHDQRQGLITEPVSDDRPRPHKRARLSVALDDASRTGTSAQILSQLSHLIGMRDVSEISSLGRGIMYVKRSY